MTGTVTNLFIKTGHREPMIPQAKIQLEAGQGIPGDHSYGRSSRQILLVDLAVITSFELQPGWLRENITTTGIDLNSLHSGDILEIGGSQLEIVGECTPCSRLDEIRPGLQREISGERGVLARVVQDGTIHVDDLITKIET